MISQNKRYVVILAGGAGERFWPLSTTVRPKQFLRLFGGKSLLRQTVERVLPIVPIGNILIITAKSLSRATYTELPEVPRDNVILEPCRKNTAPAIAAAAAVVAQRAGVDACVAVLSADQLVSKPAIFRKLLKQAYRRAQSRPVIVTLGVRPTYPATGFGYIDAARGRFVEKPDLMTARKYVKSGRYVWNAGIFIFRIRTLVELLNFHAPELRSLFDSIRSSKSVAREIRRTYPKLTSISFDYAVMEKTRSIEVVHGAFGWDDVGSYSAFLLHFPADASGNVIIGNVRKLQVSNCTLVGNGVRITAFGLDDLIVVSDGKDVLVMPQSKSQDIKNVLKLP